MTCSVCEVKFKKDLSAVENVTHVEVSKEKNDLAIESAKITLVKGDLQGIVKAKK